MSWISESLTAKVVSALSLMLLLLVGSTAAVYVQVQKQEADGEVINETGKLRMLSQRIAKSASTLGQEGVSSKRRSEAREELSRVAQQFGEGLQAVYKGDPSRSIPPAPPSVAGQLGVVGSIWSEVQPDVEQVLEAEPGSQAFREGLAGVQSQNLDLLRQSNRAVSLFEKEADSKIATLYWVLLGLLGLGAVAFAVVIVAMRRLLIAPIHRLKEAAQQVAAGNLEASVEAPTSDEIGQLADAFNTMSTQIRRSQAELKERQREHLQESVDTMLEATGRFADGDLTVRLPAGRDGAIGRLFEGFNRAVGGVRQILSGVKGAVEETASATGQIRASSDQMAASAEEQSAQAEEVAAAVEELNQTIGESTRSVQSVADAAEEGSQEARRGAEVVVETASKIEEVADVVERSADTIERLSSSSKEIGRVVDRIDEIATQTNLLALNAAIEAARAGEEGRGFAVVADEVRKLAEEAEKATSEIAEMIEQVQTEAEEAVDRVREGTRRVEGGRELAGQTGEAIESIVGSISKVEEMADEIAAASDEQRAASEEIARSVQSISTAAQESAQGVTEVSSAASQLEAVAGGLKGQVQEFEIEGKENLSADDLPEAGYGGDGQPAETHPSEIHPTR